MLLYFSNFGEDLFLEYNIYVNVSSMNLTLFWSRKMNYVYRFTTSLLIYVFLANVSFAQEPKQTDFSEYKLTDIISTRMEHYSFLR